MTAAKTATSSLPDDHFARIETIGRQLFGDAWKTRIAADLGVSRVALHKWRHGTNATPADLDQRLLGAIERAIERRERRLVGLRATANELKRRIG